MSGDPNDGDNLDYAQQLAVRCARIELHLRRLLEFAVSRTEIRLSDETIREIVVACAQAAEPTPEVETELWRQYNRLADIISPATPETVLDLAHMEEDKVRRPGVLRAWWKDKPVRRLINSSIYWMALSAFLLLFTQVGSVLITNSLDRITAAEKTLAEIDNKLTLLNRLTPTPNANDPSADQLLQQQQELTRQRQVQVDAMMAATTVLDFVFRQGVADCKATDGAAPAPAKCELNRGLAVIRHEASIVMDSVTLSLLPLLYGWLGANVYILRRLIGGLDNWNINALLATKLSLRRFLGALLGIAVGIIYKSGGAQLTEAGFSMALFAFLAGYSVEFIFTILDTLIARGNAAFPSPYKKAKSSSTGAEGAEGAAAEQGNPA